MLRAADNWNKPIVPFVDTFVEGGAPCKAVGTVRCNFHNGVWFTWYGNSNYRWQYFAVAAGFSVVGMLLWAAVAQLLRSAFGVEGPGVSGLLLRVPGAKYLLGEAMEYQLIELPGMKWLAAKINPLEEVTQAKRPAAHFDTTNGTHGKAALDGTSM